MPPSSCHRQHRSAHNVLVRYYTRRSESVLSIDDLEQENVDQGLFSNFQATPTVDQKQSATHPSLGTISLVSLVIAILFILGGLVFFFLRCKRRLADAVGSTTTTQFVMAEDGSGLVAVEKRGMLGWLGRQSSRPQYIVHHGQGGMVLTRETPPSLKGILMASKEYTPQSPDEKQATPPRGHFRSGKNQYRIPTMAFDSRSPVIRPPSPIANTADISVDSPYSLLHERVNIIVSEDMSNSSSSSNEFSSPSRQSDFTISEYQRSLTTDGSSAPHTPQAQIYFDPQVQITSYNGVVEEGERNRTDLLPRLRDYVPRLPSVNLSLSSFTISPTKNVRRSFTAPALFRVDTASEANKRNSVVSLKPSSTRDNRESVNSNFITTLMERLDHNDSLLNEGFPPPAIIVSPPTASTINSANKRMSWLGEDVWAQGCHPTGVRKGSGVVVKKIIVVDGVQAPPEYDAELSKNRGSWGPPRPVRATRRASVQPMIDG